MSHDRYADPYAGSAAYQSHQYQPSHSYADNELQPPEPPYTESGGYQASSSTEKMVDASMGTERLHKGRQGPQQGRSWAEAGPPPRSTGILRMWRKGERGKQWSRGGGARTFLRFCCCSTTLIIILLVSIILAILLYVRPPNLKLNSINIGSSGVTLASNGFSLSLTLGISVANPNWFNVDFKEVSATVRYPGNNTNSFGGGTLYNLDFQGYTDSTFDFPLTLNYSTSIDPNRVILDDLISKCGSSSNQITIDYNLYLKLKILGVTISPTISSDASFACPISASDIESIAGNS
ncbi:hypothetical protein EHS25_007636 [Saitozyma podzolica]|uniref:Late embryogenesis abundant protein LEA-2 subgroup domain-containing protein n=1 Tax=Saitozyma podzolica TaxID=1890683 RepID=A0A427YQA8_9TREE|nr:hypothetical protein EHS25_007636 [Saitozyma podzolica]